MQKFRCTCGNVLFFGNSRCMQCSRTVVRCASCRLITTADPVDASPDHLRCTNAGCGAELTQCHNAVEFGACHGTLARSGPVEPSVDPDQKQLCRYCQLNRVVPDLSRREHLRLWKRLERAKHRALYGIESLGFPVECDSADPAVPVLAFDFKSGEEGPVTTGHASGLITVNINEADSVERERTRVEFREPKRTLVAHIRHELGHYYWLRLVAPSCLDEFRAVFGDERQPTYKEALDIYYENGPAADWHTRVVSRYASMHPWEDFAETFRVYTEMAALVETADSFAVFNVDRTSFDAMLASYRRYGVFANEANREMGLTDLVPERFSPAVVSKLKFIHSLRG